MKKDVLEKRFKHSKWFTEGVTVAYALDNFAKSGDFYLDKRPSKIQSDGLFDSTNYDAIITDRHGFYRLSEEEKQFYLEREQYWNEQKEIEEQKWLETEIDIEKELNSYLSCNSNYDITYAEKELQYATKDSDVDRINFWTKEVNRRTETRSIIDNLITEYKSTMKTNRDFIVFKEIVKQTILDRMTKVA